MIGEANGADYPLFGPAGRAQARKGAMVLARHGRLLMQLRDDRSGVAAPGLWGLFGGALEPGEGPADAARRELAEETGLALPEATFQPFGRLESAAARLYALTLSVPVAPGAIRLSEGAGFAFFTPRQVRAGPIVPVLVPLLDAYLQGE